MDPEWTTLLPGPVPGLGLQPNYYLTLAAIIVAGFGLGAQLVAAFAEAQKAADNGGRALRPGGLQVVHTVPGGLECGGGDRGRGGYGGLTTRR